MEGVGARLGRTSARYGPATTFTGPVRKWRKEWIPVAAAAAASNATAGANGGAASSTSAGSGSGSRGNNLLLFKWTPVNGANGGGGGGDGEQQAATVETATRRRRYVPVRFLDKNCWLSSVDFSGAAWVRICNIIGSLAYFGRSVGSRIANFRPSVS